jgi:hypothetical protein
MSQPLGNPEEQTPISVTATAAEIEIYYGLRSVEFQNTGSNDVYFGKLSTLTSARGGIIYSNGDRKIFENIPSGWKISFLCETGKTSTLRRIDYK